MNSYLSQRSSSRVSNLIVGQGEKQQGSIQPQALTSQAAGGQHLSRCNGNNAGRINNWLLFFCFFFTRAICAAPASPMELNARLSDKRFLLAVVEVESAEPIKRAPSTPIRLFRRDRWVRLRRKKKMTWIGYVCAPVCTKKCLLMHDVNVWLTCCLQREEGGSSALEERSPPVSQL